MMSRDEVVAEYNLIRAKESKLSRSEREAIIVAVHKEVKSGRMFYSEKDEGLKP